MKIFQINDQLQIVCKWGKTRDGFMHRATLLRNGAEVAKARESYLNRTWESYEYETVIEKLVNNKKTDLTNDERELVLRRCKEIAMGRVNDMFRMAGTVAKMGEFLAGDTQKEKNDWKKRMLKAGLEISFPDDWDDLPEDEKARRLDGVIEMATKG